MFKAVRHLSGRDKRALAVFFGIAFFCWLYFASGILVTKAPLPSDEIEMAKDGTGYTVRVLGLRDIAAAEQLSRALRDQRGVRSKIEEIPSEGGYLINIGPLSKLQAAEALTSELLNAGFNIVKIVDNCGPGGNCNPEQVKNK
ncbi:MAG: SPOR domain-containing protein [Blastocatellia bacterium]|nr:SPOR domain-containing protein [Blastocatellia bacterium]